METVIRIASPEDFQKVYDFSLGIPELRVDSDSDFMSPDEFMHAMTRETGVFLVAEEQETICGFTYANSKNSGLCRDETWACLVYLAVHPDHRGKGLGKRLHEERIRLLKERGVTHVYTFANPESGIIPFHESNGLVRGKEFVWMSGRL